MFNTSNNYEGCFCMEKSFSKIECVFITQLTYINLVLTCSESVWMYITVSEYP